MSKIKTQPWNLQGRGWKGGTTSIPAVDEATTRGPPTPAASVSLLATLKFTDLKDQMRSMPGPHFLFFLNTDCMLGNGDCNVFWPTWLGWGHSHLGKAGIAGGVREGWTSLDPRWHKHHHGKR